MSDKKKKNLKYIDFDKYFDELPKDMQQRMLDEVANRRVMLILQELRESKGISQAKMAEMLNIKQPSISRIENSEDIKVSTLLSYIAALGGNVKITVDDTDVILNQKSSDNS